MANVTPRMSAADYLARSAPSKSKSRSKLAPADAAGPASRSKYGNRRVGQFDSEKEARAHAQLTLMRQAADPSEQVVEIEHHVRYEVIPAQVGERAAFYEADFRVTYADGRVEVIDVKSAITRKEPRYILKRKLMLQVHGIRIREI